MKTYSISSSLRPGANFLRALPSSFLSSVFVLSLSYCMNNAYKSILLALIISFKSVIMF